MNHTIQMKEWLSYRKEFRLYCFKSLVQTLLFHWTFVKVNFASDFTNGNFTRIRLNFPQNYKISKGHPQRQNRNRYVLFWIATHDIRKVFSRKRNFICIIFDDNILLFEYQRKSKVKSRRIEISAFWCLRLSFSQGWEDKMHNKLSC